MRPPASAVSLLAMACLLGVAAPRVACEPDGDIQFVCGPVSPEELALVPQSSWVLVSSWEDDGYLSGADTRDHTTTVLFPTATSQGRHDTASRYAIFQFLLPPT